MAIPDFAEFNRDKERLEREIGEAVSRVTSSALSELYEKYHIAPTDIDFNTFFTPSQEMGKVYEEKVLCGVDVKMRFEL